MRQFTFDKIEKVKHWRAVSDINGLKGPPVLDFIADTILTTPSLRLRPE